MSASVINYRVLFCLFFTDKMGIKTTVHQIIAAKQNLSVPDPVTHDDFLKCEFFNLCVLECKCSLNMDFRATIACL